MDFNHWTLRASADVKHEWFKPRNYKHFDAPVGEKFANQKATDASFVGQHDWLPLIHYVKRVKRYKPGHGREGGKTVYKDRDIMYASHRDACLLAKYANDLSNHLDKFYEDNKLSDHIIAYRRLGKANYEFSSEAYQFCLRNSPCVVLCFDITGFFDHLDHGILKERLRRILDVRELPNDWYKIFRHVTQFRKIGRADLAAHSVFGQRLKSKTRDPIATIAEIKNAGIPIHRNPNKFGIPQGTPISSALSNLYMIDVDKSMSAICLERKALYQRYSDDILVVCRPEDEATIAGELLAAVVSHKLEIKTEKTERVQFDPALPRSFQYLGFNASPDGAYIRPSSLSRQWRKAKRGIKKIRRIGLESIQAGKAEKIYTKKLRRKLSPVGVRNFSSYARRSADAFGSPLILRQIRRFEQRADKAIRDLKALQTKENIGIFL